MKKRTVKDFVKSMFKKKRPPGHIRAVALCTRWKNNMDEVEKWIAKGIQIQKKKRTKSKKIKIKKIFLNS